MLRGDWAAFSFLLAGLILAALPVWYGGSILTDPGDSALHDSYYVVAHWHIGLLPQVASILFGLVYLVGRRVFRLEFRRVWVWLHFVFWVVGTAILLGPQFLLQVITSRYSVGYSVDFDTYNLVFTVGYCVTLLSTAVFAICIGSAIIRRVRTDRSL